MGKTVQIPPQNRIMKWEKDDIKTYIEIFTIRTKYNSKLEAVVHALFNYSRKKRVINEKNRI